MLKHSKNILKSILISFLSLLAHGIVLRYKPLVIMVTGSVGKTSTKDAIAAALGDQFYLRKTEKSQNSEFGVPLTIIGVKNPWGSMFGWVNVIGEAMAMLVLPNHYPSLLVLEVGADRPGDLAKILRIVTPDAVVVTLLPEVPVHVEAYATPAEVREEEFTPATALATGAPLIINANDRYAFELATRTSARVYTFGTSTDADVSVENGSLWVEEGQVTGMQAELAIGDDRYPLKVRNSFGDSQFFAPAAAVATAMAFDVSPQEALAGLDFFVTPPGRGRLFKGIKNTVLIDDSYNASPVAVSAALASLKLLPPDTRKVGILGDMLELGRYSLDEHVRIGGIAGKTLDLLITVGTRSKSIGTAAIETGMSEGDVYHFANSYDAALAVPDLLKEGDAILLKGSQSGVRLERIVKALLADPADVHDLVRQESEWQKR